MEVEVGYKGKAKGPEKGGPSDLPAHALSTNGRSSSKESKRKSKSKGKGNLDSRMSGISASGFSLLDADSDAQSLDSEWIVKIGRAHV